MTVGENFPNRRTAARSLANPAVPRPRRICDPVTNASNTVTYHFTELSTGKSTTSACSATASPIAITLLADGVSGLQLSPFGQRWGTVYPRQPDVCTNGMAADADRPFRTTGRQVMGRASSPFWEELSPRWAKRVSGAHSELTQQLPFQEVAARRCQSDAPPVHGCP